MNDTKSVPDASISASAHDDLPKQLTVPNPVTPVDNTLSSQTSSVLQFRVHPEFVGLDIVGNGSKNAVTAVLQDFLDFLLCLSVDFGQKSFGVGANGSLVEVARFEQGGRNSLVHAFLRVVLEQKLKGRKNSNRPDSITLESGIDGDQVDGTNNIIDHVLVQGVDRVAVFLGEGGKSLTDGSDLCVDVFGSSVFACKIGVSGSRFVSNLNQS